MKYAAAYLLAQLGGKDSPSEADVKAVLASVSAEVDDAKLSAFFAAIDGKDVAELIKEGTAKLATVGGGGGGGGGGGAAADDAARAGCDAPGVRRAAAAAQHPGGDGGARRGARREGRLFG
mmetsp:Transcript_4459/g.19020  ORF Transcript_4459/g.19020 Transcript_4459/m.19020 type:complete len:121 (-) Transcript_4459:777-1139(-)